MSAPTPVPYYRPRPRSIFGPLVLITIGVLFLLRTTGVIPRQTFTWWFVHYWPVLLIVWGAAKLLEYMWARSKGEPTPRLGGGAIVFLVFFILTGMAATRTADWNWHGLGTDIGIDESDFDWFSSRYTFTEDLAQPMQGGTQIKILGSRGDINVIASPDGQAHILVHKTLRTDSQESANRLNDATHPRFTQQGGLWLLDLTSGDFEHGQYDLDLQLPRQVPLFLVTHRGNLSVSQREGNVDLTTDRGNISAEDVKGSAFLHLRNGSVTIKNITGDVQLDGGVDDGTISDVTGTLDFNAGYNGDVQLSHIGQRLHLKSVRTDLQVAKLEGELNLGRGELRGSGVSGPVKLTTRSNEVHLEDVAGAVEIENRNGVVEIRAKAPLAAIDINNVRGGIELDLPANAGFRLDAESKDGNIDSDFNVNVDNSGRNATARGSVGKSGPDVRLRADRGTIQIRKSQ